MPAKRAPGFISRTLLFINLGFLACLLLSYLAVYVNPSTFWPIAFFGLAYPVFLLSNLLFVFFWILRGRWWFLLSLAGILGGYNFLADTIAFNPGSDHSKTAGLGESAGRHQIRAMTFNVHFFKRFDAQLNEPVKQAMLQLVREEKPDLLFLQEFFTRTKGHYTIKDSIRLIMNTPWFVYHACDSNHFESLGIAICSKYPLKNRVFVPLSAERHSVNGAIMADLILPGKTLRVISVHLQSISFGPEDYHFLDQLKSLKKPGVESYRHVGGKLKLAFIRRSEQALTIARLIRESPYPVIIGGDFNDPPVSFAYHTLSRNLQNCFTRKGSGFAKTYNGSFPNFQIDYLLCDSLFHVDNYKIIKKDLSDHYPVRSDLSWSEK